VAGAPSPHEEILLNAAPKGGAIRVGDWKLKIDRTKEGERVELFNLVDDLSEQQNLAEQMPEQVRLLRKRYDRFEAEAVPPKNK